MTTPDGNGNTHDDWAIHNSTTLVVYPPATPFVDAGSADTLRVPFRGGDIYHEYALLRAS